VAAHADDVEVMAWHAVLHAEGLAAVIVTDGRGSTHNPVDFSHTSCVA
jgi:hypothetical protein